jgi:uncharacterized protein (DUF2267 family)
MTTDHRATPGAPKIDYDEFVTTVATILGVDGDIDSAQLATEGVLPTLAERLGKDGAVTLVAELGPKLGGLLFTAGPPRPLSASGFLARVADREGVDLSAARRHTVAVFVALARAVSPKEYDHLGAGLPKDFTPLLPSREYTGVATTQQFVAAVAVRAGIPVDRARGLTEAVLATIAEPLAPGAVDGLRAQLPVELHTALDRGLARNPGSATRLPVDRFVARVAEHAAPLRPRPGPDQLHRYARMVFDVLRDTVTDKEFYDLTAQLPDAYWGLQADPPAS